MEVMQSFGSKLVTFAVLIAVLSGFAIALDSFYSNNFTAATSGVVVNETVSGSVGGFVLLSNSPSASLVCGPVYDGDTLIDSSRYECSAVEGFKFLG